MDTTEMTLRIWRMENFSNRVYEATLALNGEDNQHETA